MIVTKIAVVVGVLVFVALCVLTAMGVSALEGPLLTVVILVVLVAGANLLGAGRGAPPGGGTRR